MTILQCKRVSRFGIPFTLVLTEGQVNDVAVYELRGHHTAEETARHGHEWSRRDFQTSALFDLPPGKHYRI